MSYTCTPSSSFRGYKLVITINNTQLKKEYWKGRMFVPRQVHRIPRKFPTRIIIKEAVGRFNVDTYSVNSKEGPGR